MAASGDTVEMRVEFERPLTDEKVVERCRAIAEFLEDDEPTAEELLKQAEKSRKTVSRVLEYVRGERDAGDVRKGDWFAAIEHVADETGEDLVLYSESTHPNTHDSATIYAVDDRYGRIIQTGWTEYKVSSGEADFLKPTYRNRDVVEGGFRFEADRPREVLHIEEAKERLREFAADHEGGDA